MFYADPYQDLIIDLQPGLQMLDGAAAEGLVRYRSGHADGDYGRIRVQQEFMQAAAGQIMARDAVTSNLLSYLNVFINHVDTNMGVLDMPRYLGLAGRIDTDNMTMHTLGGSGTSINGRFFHIVGEEDVADFAAAMFYNNYTAKQEPVQNSFGFDIQVLNGTNIVGLAAQNRDMLTEHGYRVVGIGNYHGEHQAATRILVRHAGTGHDLLEFFSGAAILTDTTINSDIVIILGAP